MCMLLNLLTLLGSEEGLHRTIAITVASLARQKGVFPGELPENFAVLAWVPVNVVIL